MTDYPTLTQQAAFAARIGSLSEAVANRIVMLPEDQREAGLTMVRRTYAADLKENGLDNEHGHKWLDLQIDAIRRRVAEIEIAGDEGALKVFDDEAMANDNLIWNSRHDEMSRMS